MSFEISIQEFNRQFQLYQKKDRYNLFWCETSLIFFIIAFFQEEIEDLKIIYASKENLQIIEKTVNSTSFSLFFGSVEDLLDYNIMHIDGYFSKYDFYFNGVDEFIELNYIKRDILFEIVDRILNGLDCNYKSRLKTELLINMEFD